jgi:hypothetical protein
MGKPLNRLLQDDGRHVMTSWRFVTGGSDLLDIRRIDPPRVDTTIWL